MYHNQIHYVIEEDSEKPCIAAPMHQLNKCRIEFILGLVEELDRSYYGMRLSSRTNTNQGQLVTGF